jgi:CheY-like chemotaxis protein
VTILVADERIEAIEDVAAALRDAGLRLGSTLPATGVITGSVEDEAALEALAAVDGVAAVERAQEIQIPPPDEPVQ